MPENDKPTLFDLFIVFARISALSIGGGYVMFPLMKRDLVDSKEWLTAERLIDFYALGQSIPGIIAMNTATLVGYRKRGILGAMASAAGMAAPSVIVILIIAAFFTPYFDHPWVQKAFAGIRAAVVGMIVTAVWQVGQKAINSVSKAAIAVGSFLAIIGLGAHPVLMIVTGGLLGALLFREKAAS